MSTKNPTKSSYFACILYPECAEHAYFAKWLQEQSELSVITILHDKDIDTEAPTNEQGILPFKKAHWHVLVKFPQRKSVAGANAFSANMIHMEMVVDGYAYAKYLTHSDFKSRLEGKHQYSIEDVKGNERGLSLYAELIGIEDIQTCSQFAEFAYTLANNEGMLSTTLPEFVKNPQNATFVRQYQGILSTMANQNFKIARVIEQLHEQERT